MNSAFVHTSGATCSRRPCCWPCQKSARTAIGRAQRVQCSAIFNGRPCFRRQLSLSHARLFLDVARDAASLSRARVSSKRHVMNMRLLATLLAVCLALGVNGEETVSREEFQVRKENNVVGDFNVQAIYFMRDWCLRLYLILRCVFFHHRHSGFTISTLT